MLVKDEMKSEEEDFIEYNENSEVKSFQSLRVDNELFKDDSYIKIISEEVLRQMREQMQELNGNFYWIDPADAPFGEVFSEIDPNQSFYINSDRKLVIAFGEYEVAPGYVGTPEFVIDQALLKEILVSDRYLK